jgi:outer membrane protein OmpA-like peptidoglycan-associated protein
MNSNTIAVTVLFPALFLTGCSLFGGRTPAQTNVVGRATTPQMLGAHTASPVNSVDEAILFSRGSDRISSAGGQTIDSIANVLASDRLLRVSVRGYADAMGSRDTNQRLSERRATAVSERLVQHGVARLQIDSLGFGTADPAASNGTATGREQNRRVHLTVTAPQGRSIVDPA